jgi:hypothetical protein
VFNCPLKGKVPEKIKGKKSLTEWVSIGGYKSKVKSQHDIFLRVRDYIVSHNIISY